MAFIGICIAAVCAAALISGYTSDKRARLGEYEGVCKLLVHIRGAISGTGKTLGEAISDFECPELSRSRLLQILGCGTDNTSCTKTGALRAERSFRESVTHAHFLIGKEDELRLVRYLSEFGRSCLEEELERLSKTLSFFEERQKTEKMSVEKDIKVAWLLFATAFVSILILAL